MMTRDQLAETLRNVNVEDLARESGLSTKTIYRLRNKQHAPTLDTVEQIMSALGRMTSTRAPQPTAAQGA